MTEWKLLGFYFDTSTRFHTFSTRMYYMIGYKNVLKDKSERFHILKILTLYKGLKYLGQEETY